MTAQTQIIVLLFSYLYGLIFYFLNKLNTSIIKNQKRFYQSFLTILFMYNIVLIYLITLFKLNNGNFHLYFFLMLTLGFLSGYKLNKLLLNNVKFQNFLAKLKKKCYTKKK